MSDPIIYDDLAERPTVSDQHRPCLDTILANPDDDGPDVKCKECNGRGEIRKPNYVQGNLLDFMKCPDCGGKGCTTTPGRLWDDNGRVIR